MTRSGVTDPVTVEAVHARLRTRALGQHLHLLAETDSTNREALVRAQAGAESGMVVVAESQTAGRGRRGRIWHSPAGENLYCSVIFGPPTAVSWTTPRLPWIPLLTGVAVVTAIRDLTDLSPSLKWPNDLLLNHKKCGGILCETAQRGSGHTFTIIGVGLNVNSHPDSFPAEFRAASTSLRAETGTVIDRAALLAQILNRLESQLELLTTATQDRWREEYVAYCSTVGQRVRVECADGRYLEGLAQAIGEDGCLRIDTDQSQAVGPSACGIEVRAGDVMHLRATC